MSLPLKRSAGTSCGASCDESLTQVAGDVPDLIDRHDAPSRLCVLRRSGRLRHGLGGIRRGSLRCGFVVGLDFSGPGLASAAGMLIIIC